MRHKTKSGEKPVLVARVGSKVTIESGAPRKLLSDLRSSFTHVDPSYHRKKNMGFKVWGQSSVYKTFQPMELSNGEKTLILPRGRGVAKLRELCSEYGVDLKLINEMTVAPCEWPRFQVDPKEPTLEPRWYQEEIVDTCLKKVQGVVRAPTGSGKTKAALYFLSRLGQRAIVIVRNKNLLDQWILDAAKCFGVEKSDIGVIKSGRKFVKGKFLYVAMQQSLYSKKRSNAMQSILDNGPFGAVVIDEGQLIAASTFQAVANELPCLYRIAFSADETRKDGMEFVTYDTMGPVIYEVSREELEKERVILPVTVRVVPTNFRADWYAEAEPNERNFKRLIDEITTDPERNALLANLTQKVTHLNESPCLIFTHRREHAFEFSDQMMFSERGIDCGLLLGGEGSNSVRYQEDLEKLMRQEIKIAIGTFDAIGVGIDIPIVRSGIVATPISKSNPQFFGQVRGRICRKHDGKTEAIMYYLWDRHIFPRMVDKIWHWNDGRVQYYKRGRWIDATKPSEVSK